ncbi:MAG TPA: A/G-specific adenine glycosylase [Thiobacillaceae bacterium]|nr:A/G-specific adenine glycosylase [Thiobacillaceae bacterium]
MPSDFASRLVAWQRRHGRHDLPWQASRDPYPIWLSEIMLQQTQVETVIPFFQRFLTRFPDLTSLAGASQDEVLALWSGLGYYSRARNLHAAAQRVAREHGGRIPANVEDLRALPGIGRSTAAAIASLAFGQRQAILDGNVKRVLARVFGIEGWSGDKSVENRLWALAESLLPLSDVEAYTQGLMDLGATLCTRARPRCDACPFQDECLALRQGRQKELPGPRPKKMLPEKSVAMLVLLRAGDVLLEKRPATGIWGGLWSLPECDEASEPVTAARVLGYTASSASELPAFAHVFSHFRLFVRPWALPVESIDPAVHEPGRLWLPLSEVENAALPTPVRRILQGVALAQSNLSQ